MPKGFFISLFSSMEKDKQANDMKAQLHSQQEASADIPSSSSEGSSTGGSGTENFPSILEKRYV